jgi:hypothetical protein
MLHNHQHWGIFDHHRPDMLQACLRGSWVNSIQGYPPSLERCAGGAHWKFWALIMNITNLFWDWMTCEPTTWQWTWVPCAMTGWRRGVIMVFQSSTRILPSHTDQQIDVIGSMQGGCDCVAGRSPGICELHSRIQLGDIWPTGTEKLKCNARTIVWCYIWGYHDGKYYLS